ncbi:MAG TPA: tetraacyldisaccharide 4'-kinase [Bacteroidia bacterium]|nr:tetraacyldisaccharide 4'-kinase [Bacteroidia bacterium]
MKWRIWLLPFSLLYGVVIIVRNILYDLRILKSKRFSVPVISIGNLTAGGSGKTPMTEHIIRLLSPQYRVATLSRGYGRKTSGFVLVSATTNASLIGDEPMLYHTKYKEVTVATSESRREGIEKLISLEKKPQVILLDDAYQHRSVKPGLNILLIEYETIFQNKFLLPAGNFREPFGAKSRADVIIVTKCPPSIDDNRRIKAQKKIKPSFHQQVWFSYLVYDELKPFASYWKKEILSAPETFGKNTRVLLLTGIANPLPLKIHVTRSYTLVRLLRYADHYDFTETDIKRMRKIFSNIVGEEKIILTTEKDAMRLMKENLIPLLSELPVYVLPVKVKFLQKYSETSDNTILEYVRKNSANS